MNENNTTANRMNLVRCSCAYTVHRLFYRPGPASLCFRAMTVNVSTSAIDALAIVTET